MVGKECSKALQTKIQFVMTIMGFISHDFMTNCGANVSTTFFSKNIGLGKQAHETSEFLGGSPENNKNW
jgi:hypothetical protein